MDEVGRGAAVEKWLREDAVSSVEEYRADPSTGIPANEVMQRVREMVARMRRSKRE